MLNLVQAIVEAGELTMLVRALAVAGLVPALEGPGPFTIFAPHDGAFDRMSRAARDGLMRDRLSLRSVLAFHVIPGRVLCRDILLANGMEPRTLGGHRLELAVRDGVPVVGGASVTAPDTAVANGVIHVIDQVLLPTAAPAAAAR